MNLPEQQKLSLPRNLNLLEYFGFSLTGLLVWQGTVGSLNASLGLGSIWVWLPCVIVAMTLNLQLKRLGHHLPDIAGGTASYTTRLLSKVPLFARYSLSGYYLSWVALIPINAIVLTDLIKIHTKFAEIEYPAIGFQLGFTLIPFILALSGTRALSILHLFFMIPTIGIMLLFVLQGLGWLAFSPNSPGLIPQTWPTISLIDWIKWYFIAVYAVYACEGGAAFVADSRNPNRGLNCLLLTTGLLPIVYLGGSWVVSQLATDPGLKDSAFRNLLSAATPFWGQSASVWITLLIGFTNLLSSATTVSLCIRVLYQASLDGYSAPVFQVMSRRGVLVPALLVTLILSLGCLIWGDVVRIIFITGTGYVIAMMAFHLGIWLKRSDQKTQWATWSLGCFIVEAIVLIIGGIAWNWQDFCLGLSLPVVLLLLDQSIRHLRWKVFSLRWWQAIIDKNEFRPSSDFIALQINLLLFLLCGATLTGWFIQSYLTHNLHQNTELLVILVLTTGFIGIAIAAWTSLPQVIAIAEAEEKNRIQAQYLEQSLQELKTTQLQLVQSEKMSSLGQLVAGVAHEINNPINFIYGNIPHMEEYIHELLDLIQLYQNHYPQAVDEIQNKIDDIELDFIQEDLLKILSSMRLGANRVKSIIISLRNFSRVDESDFKTVNVHDGIESTLIILQNRLKSKNNTQGITVVKQYSDLPLIECYAGQLNQVFMNVLVNAIDAIESFQNQADSPQELREHLGIITITTRQDSSQQISISIMDNGPGMPESVRQRVFDPFYTTKPIGQGTGLGLSISYQIITEKHGGTLSCFSQPEQGTEFVITLPITKSTTSSQTVS